MIQQQGSQLLPLWRGADRWVRRFQYPCLTDPECRYAVAIDTEGKWGCSCPAWTHAPKRKACEHIRARMAK